MEKLLEFEKDKIFDERSKYYRFQCDCLTPSDAMDIGVDSCGKDDEDKCLTISMYFDGTGLLSRIKYAWQIIKGHWCWREFIVREEDFKHLSDIFNPDKKFSELPNEMIEMPKFKSEDEERDFWATHDSVDFLEGTEQVYLESDYPIKMSRLVSGSTGKWEFLTVELLRKEMKECKGK